MVQFHFITNITHTLTFNLLECLLERCEGDYTLMPLASVGTITVQSAVSLLGLFGYKARNVTFKYIRQTTEVRV